MPEGEYLLRAVILAVVMAVTSSACGSGGGGMTAVILPPPNNPVVTPLHDTQGSGSASPMDGQNVTVRGIVTLREFQHGKQHYRHA